MRKLNKILIGMLLCCFICCAGAVSVSAETENINFPDPNLKNALIKSEIDSNGDGEISKTEALYTGYINIDNAGVKDLTGLEYFTGLTYLDAENNEITDISVLGKMLNLQTVIIRDNKISDASALSNLENLSYINIEYNNLTDLTPFLSMPKLSYLSIVNNHFKTSVLAGVDDNTLAQLKELEKHAQVYGAYRQKMTYDESLLPNNVPTHKVLVSVVKDIDATSKLGENGDFRNVQSKYTMSEKEINILRAYTDLFEKYVAKISGYTIKVETDFYVTDKPLKEIYCPTADYGLYKSYAVFAPDVPELVSKVNQYDATITVCYVNPETHDYSGIAGFGWNEQISGNNKYYNRGVVFIPWDSFAHQEGNFHTAEHAQQLCYDDLIDDFMHEYIHTFEQYSTHFGYNNIQEFHTALAEWTPLDDPMDAMANYLQGGKFENGSIGIPDDARNNPPTILYSEPDKVTGLKYTAKGSDYVNLSWNESSDADGYVVYRQGSNKTVTSKKNSVKISSLSPNTKYSFTVKPYKYFSSDDSYIYGEESSKITITTGPAKVKSLKAVPSTSSIKLSWKASSKATGYRIERYDSTNKEWESVVRTKNTSATVSKLSSGTVYQFRVTSYRKSGNNTYYGNSSNLTTATKPYAAKIKSVKRLGTKMTVNLSKVNKADGYEVQLSKKKSFSSISKKVRTKNTTVKLSNLSKNQKYYVRVRSYKNVDGERIYSSYTKYSRAK